MINTVSMDIAHHLPPLPLSVSRRRPVDYWTLVSSPRMWAVEFSLHHSAEVLPQGPRASRRRLRRVVGCLHVMLTYAHQPAARVEPLDGHGVGSKPPSDLLWATGRLMECLGPAAVRCGREVCHALSNNHGTALGSYLRNSSLHLCAGTCRRRRWWASSPPPR